MRCNVGTHVKNLKINISCLRNCRNPTPEPFPAPGNNLPIEWLPLTSDNHNYLDITTDKISVKQNLRQKNHALWREYIPWIINNTRNDSS